MSPIYKLQGAGFAYQGRTVLSGVSMPLESGQLVAIAGPNGAGKSTLLGICAGIRGAYLGECLYRGKQVREWNRRQFAREVAFVPQNLAVEFPFTAEQVVMMGRAPYGDGLFESDEDLAAARKAMELTDSLEFAPRDFRSLSGGERQRVVLAAAIAQFPKVLLLDEPTTFLDLKHQIAIYDLLRQLATQGLLVVTVTHDLNLALSYADQVLLLEVGRMRAFGPVRDVLTAQTVHEVFGVTASIHAREDGRGWVMYG